jgi:hypothetical protein
MIKRENNQTGRREFLARAVPICAATCLGASRVFARSPHMDKPLPKQNLHKFDREIPGPKLTYRRIATYQHRSYIQFARFLQKELGEDETIRLIKKHTDEKLLERAQKDLKRLGKSDFKSYISIFRDPRMLAGLNMEIIRDTDKVFEIRVTDCLSAVSFLAHKAGDIGFASVCWGDTIWASAFNPKIRLVRDKTLMQGHDCCNHKYIWT